MPGEGSSSHWDRASHGNFHCLEKVVGLSQIQTLLMPILKDRQKHPYLFQSYINMLLYMLRANI